MVKKLYSIDEAESLKIGKVKKLYTEYISSAQSDLFSRFAFGEELVSSASGCYITTREGKVILDATGGIGVLNHGHNHPRILEARSKFAHKKSMEVHKAFHSPYLAVLASNISALLPDSLTHSYFPNSGAEAVESAMKMAYKFHGGKRKTILHADISFHGKLFGSGSVTGSSEIGFDFPKISGVDKFRYNDIESFRSTFQKYVKGKECDIYAVIIEPINVSSLKSCSSQFLMEIRELCNQYQVILIFDEVYSGWCKTGDLFYFMRTPLLVPDILCYAKSFGGGKASISGITAKGEIYEQAYNNNSDALLQSTTYFGFGEETITAIEALQIIVDDDYVGKSKELEKRFFIMLERLKSKFPEQIDFYRGAGALWGIKLITPNTGKFLNSAKQITPFRKDNNLVEKLTAGAMVDFCYRAKDTLLFMSANQDTLLKISLPLIATETEMQKLEMALEEGFEIGLDKLLAKFVGKNIVKILK